MELHLILFDICLVTVSFQGFCVVHSHSPPTSVHCSCTHTLTHTFSLSLQETNFPACNGNAKLLYLSYAVPLLLLYFPRMLTMALLAPAGANELGPQDSRCCMAVWTLQEWRLPSVALQVTEGKHTLSQQTFVFFF